MTICVARLLLSQGPLNGGVSNGGVSRSGLVLPFLSFFVLFWDFPDFSGIFPICSGMVRGFSRFVLFRFLGLLRAPTRNSPERVCDIIWTFPEKSGKSRKRGVEFKGGSRHDRNRHNRRNRQNRQNRHGCLIAAVFSRRSKRRARCFAEPNRQNRQNRQNRHEGYPP